MFFVSEGGEKSRRTKSQIGKSKFFLPVEKIKRQKINLIEQQFFHQFSVTFKI